MTRPLCLVSIIVLMSGLAVSVSCGARTRGQVSLQAPLGLAFTSRGRGPAVVLVHGALGDYRQWEPISRRLSRGYRVIALSRRFHWPNPPPAGDVDYTFEAQSADLDALLQLLGRPSHLIGHSYGAGVALLTALRHPELVRSLVLIEPPFASVVPPSAPGFESELASRDAMVAALRAGAEAGADQSAAEALMDWVQGGPGGFSRLPPATQEEVRANAVTIGPTYAAPAPVVTCAQLRVLQLPVLILRGEQTRSWYRLIADATAGCIPRAEAAIIPGGRHMAIVEDPRGSADLIAPFIARH